jgi:hypothetical protein
MRQIYELSNLARRAQTEIPELVPASHLPKQHRRALGEFEIVREVHDIQGGNGVDASFRFLTIN